MWLGASGSNWRRKDEWFAQAMDELRNQIFDVIEENVFKLAVEGPVNSSAALSARKFLLTHHVEGSGRNYATSLLSKINSGESSLVQILDSNDAT